MKERNSELKNLQKEFLKIKEELKEYHDLERNQNGKKIVEILEEKLQIERDLWESQ